MKTSLGLTCVGTTLLLAAAPNQAQASDKLYFDVSAGGALPQHIAIQQSPFGNSGNVEPKTGERGDLSVGYNFLPHFAAELDTGVIWNGIESISGNNFGAQASSGDLYEIPLLVNLIYKPCQGAFQPYIGVGAGGVVAHMSSTSVALFGGSFSDTDITFAYQAEAGLKFVCGSKVELGLVYKFLGTTDHDWTDHGVTLKTDGTMIHSILATFTWRF